MIKMLGLIFMIVFCTFVLDCKHYMIGFYDLNLNIALLGIFWYGGWYFSENKK